MPRRNQRRRNYKKYNEKNEIIENKEKINEECKIWVKSVQPKTLKQKEYLEAIYNKDVIFCIGPAGTGKTFLACHVAANFLVEDRVDSIILCRPAVEAGEKLGFLPGNLEEKLNPYLRPLYDALNHMLSKKVVNQMIDEGVIEVVPLAYMRGRTLNNAFVILDEAQNTTPTQMKMFLTRMGDYSKFLVNGDITQTDLDDGKYSGLVDARNRLKNIEGIAWIELGKEDIVRHPIVQKIVDAYIEAGTIILP